MQKTKLPRRLANSAKDLAWASLSGLACELEDLRLGKQAGSSTQASHYHNIQKGEPSRSKTDLYALENSFRNQASATASRAAEEEFSRFNELKPFQSEWQLPEITRSLTFFGNPQKDSDRFENNTLSQHRLQPDAATRTDIIDFIGQQTSTCEIGVVNKDLHDSKVDIARGAATRRLAQITAHFQANLAMRALQQEASERSYLAASVLQHNQHETNQQAASANRGIPQSYQSETVSNSRQASQHHHPISKSDRPPVSVRHEEDEDDSQLSFHCPYYACHQNLQHLRSSLSASGQKQCVHTGCDYQSEALNAWNEHIASPHHDLQRLT